MGNKKVQYYTETIYCIKRRHKRLNFNSFSEEEEEGKENIYKVITLQCGIQNNILSTLHLLYYILCKLARRCISVK